MDMASLPIDSLLEPVPGASPCGKDMEYEPSFLELQELARGKPEQAMGDKVKAAQEPAWPKVRDAAQAMFGSTKDLRVAGILHLSYLKTSGIAGLEGGLHLISGLLDRYWDSVYPLLDAEDNNDSTLRINSLLAGLVNDDLLGTLRTTPLVESRQFGKHSLRSHRLATGVLKSEAQPTDSEPRPDTGRIEAAFSDAPLESITATAELLNAAQGHLNAIQHVLLDKAGGIPEDLKPLTTDLRDMKAVIDAQLAKRGVDSGALASAAAGDAGQDAVGNAAPSGAIRNRSDVLAAIDRVCEYYVRAEPSSPVPLLLQRAKRLVNKDFMEIVRDLTPGGVSEAEVIGGLEKRES
jgi:type VI secretion system protein ImpA